MKKLLVVVDYQNDFVSGSLGFPKAVELENAICRKIEQYKAQGDAVAFTFDTHDEHYLQTQEGHNLPVLHCIQGTQGWQLYGKVAVCCDEMTPCFYKPAFGSMELAQYVQSEHFDAIELCGLVSNICVISNAVLVKAALPEAVVYVDANCTASFDPVMNEKVFDVLEGLQIKVENR